MAMPEVGTPPPDVAVEDLASAIREVISESPDEGFVVGLLRRRRVAQRVCESYEAYGGADKVRAMATLVGECGCPTTLEEVEPVIAAWRRSKSRGSGAGSNGVGATRAGGSRTGSGGGGGDGGGGAAPGAPVSRALREALATPYERFIKFVSGVPKGVSWTINFRADLRRVISTAFKGARGGGGGKRAGALAPAATPMRDAALALSADQLLRMREMDSNLRDLFSTQQAMKTRPIDMSSAELLRFVRAKEAVHPMRSEEDLRRRVAGHARVMYGLFHPTMPTAPLVFVEIALCTEIVTKVEDILSGKARYDRDAVAGGGGPTVAMFYSVTNTSQGLQGLQLASYMLFGAIWRIRDRWRSCTNFVTLSPLPQFRAWTVDRLRNKDVYLFSRAERDHLAAMPALLAALRPLDPPPRDSPGIVALPAAGTGAGAGAAADSDEDIFQLMHRCLTAYRWHESAELVALVEPILMRWAGRYLMFERAGRKARDPVTNFHTSNGAIIERINFMAHPTDRGMAQSFGIMVNYRYDLSRALGVSSVYKQHSVVAASKAALLLQAMGQAPFFRGLSADFVDSVELPTYARVYHPGEWIHRPSDPRTAGLFFISLGLVQLVAEPMAAQHGGRATESAGKSTGASESAVVVATLRGGRVCGSAASLLLDQEDILAARATTVCHVFFAPLEPLRALLAVHPDAKAAMRHEAQIQLAELIEGAGDSKAGEVLAQYRSRL